MLAKLAYKPVGILGGLMAGFAAGALFKQIWKVAAHESEAPKATDENRGWTEVVLSAAVKGAVFAGVGRRRPRGRHRVRACHGRLARPDCRRSAVGPEAASSHWKRRQELGAAQRRTAGRRRRQPLRSRGRRAVARVLP